MALSPVQPPLQAAGAGAYSASLPVCAAIKPFISEQLRLQKKYCPVPSDLQGLVVHPQSTLLERATRAANHVLVLAKRKLGLEQQPVKAVKIGLFPHVFEDGYGDIERTHLLFQFLSKTHSVSIFVLSSRLRAAFLKMKPEMASHVSSYDFAKGLPPFDLAVTDFYASSRNIVALSEYGLRKKVKVLALTDHGENPVATPEAQAFFGKMTNVVVCALGLGKKEMGCILPRIEPLLAPGQESAVERLDLLAQTPGHVQKAIFGEKYSRQVVRRCAQNSKLYFAYNPSSAGTVAMCRAISLLERKANLIFFLQGRAPSVFPDYLMPAFKQKGRVASEALDQMRFIFPGIHTVEWVWGPATDFSQHVFKQEIAVASSSKEKRVARVIVRDREFIPHPLFLRLLEASEKEVLVTGHHSFFEALLLGKHPTFEAKTHQHQQMHSLTQFAKQQQLGAPFVRLINTLFASFTPPPPHERHRFTWITDIEKYYARHSRQIATVFRRLQRADSMQHLWQRFVTHFVSERDFFSKLNPLVATATQDKKPA